MFKYQLLLLLLFISLHALPKDKVRTELEVSPNPNNGLFTISFKSDLKGFLQISICDATGKYVFLKSKRDFYGEVKELVDLSTQPKGVYIVQTEIEQVSKATKIIIE